VILESVLHTFTEAEARELDQADPVPTRRAEFWIPPHPSIEGADAAYLAGNSLGLQPRATAGDLTVELEDWARFGVGGHTKQRNPWVSFHELLREPSARLVGALPREVISMNSLTVNLHLLMASFYRPTTDRFVIVIEDGAFPSDSYAVRSQAAWHGFDPDVAIVRLTPRPGEDCLRTEDVVQRITELGDRVALVLLGAVNYYNGEYFDIPRITAATRAVGAVSAWDLAHAVGNLELRMHDWDVDWAAWCTYKYLNSGPGAVAGAFVHERHLGARDDLPRFEGWWSTEAGTRFEMAPVSRPPATADAWQVSNPPIFAMGPVRTSLELFDQVGMAALRERSLRLTGYLARLLATAVPDGAFTVLTPADPDRRGCQLSVQLRGGSAEDLVERLSRRHGVVADARQPDVVRLAPVPLYSTHHDCWRAVEALAAEL
jgi:kynureninase